MKTLCFEFSGLDSDKMFRVDNINAMTGFEQSKEGPDYLIARKVGDMWLVDFCTPDNRIDLYATKKAAMRAMFGHMVTFMEIE